MAHYSASFPSKTRSYACVQNSLSQSFFLYPGYYSYSYSALFLILGFSPHHFVTNTKYFHHFRCRTHYYARYLLPTHIICDICDYKCIMPANFRHSLWRLRISCRYREVICVSLLYGKARLCSKLSLMITGWHHTYIHERNSISLNGSGRKQLKWNKQNQIRATCRYAILHALMYAVLRSFRIFVSLIWAAVSHCSLGTFGMHSIIPYYVKYKLGTFRKRIFVDVCMYVCGGDGEDGWFICVWYP